MTKTVKLNLRLSDQQYNAMQKVKEQDSNLKTNAMAIKELLNRHSQGGETQQTTIYTIGTNMPKTLTLRLKPHHVEELEKLAQSFNHIKTSAGLITNMVEQYNKDLLKIEKQKQEIESLQEQLAMKTALIEEARASALALYESTSQVDLINDWSRWGRNVDTLANKPDNKTKLKERVKQAKRYLLA